jgi:hypothetical protein
MPYLSTFIVGTIFAIAGIAKAISSERFILHGYRQRLLPVRAVPLTAVIFIGLESGLGIALILHAFPQWVVSCSIALLLSLSLLTFWSTSSGRTDECGCYGGILLVSPKQSLAINLGCILLLTIAWLYPAANHRTETWQWGLAALTALISSICAHKSQRIPLIDLSRLKIGNRWQYRWLKNSPYDLQKGSYIIAFLNRNCFYCKTWLHLLNILNEQKDLPQILGIMSIADEEVEAFKDERMIRFPIVSMDKLLFNYMTEVFPTAVLLEDGVIKNKWIGEIPEEFLDRIKHFYEKTLASKQLSVTSYQLPVTSYQ